MYHAPMTILFMITMLGCAGPMSPFGSSAPHALELLQHQGMRAAHLKRDLASKTRAIDLNTQVHPEVTLNFYPKVQLYHRANHWRVEIHDRSGIPTHSSLQIIYSGKDITKQVKKMGKVKLSADKKKMILSIDGLRFPAEKEHDIAVIYNRDPLISTTTHFNGHLPENHLFYRSYHPAHCQLNTPTKVKNDRLFSEYEDVLQLIERISARKNINAGLMAGLIAQESSFNPRAVSWASALGLTQVTSIAQEHILDESKQWPSYPGLDQMHYLKIKSLIMMGELNKSNEWRLDQEKSIIGGIEYLRYLETYWTQPKNWKILEKSFTSEQIDQDLLTKIILASYHSGAYRVKRTIAESQKDWLNSPRLAGANFYVKKVKSYCYDFSTEYL